MVLTIDCQSEDCNGKIRVEEIAELEMQLSQSTNVSLLCVNCGEYYVLSLDKV